MGKPSEPQAIPGAGAAPAAMVASRRPDPRSVCRQRQHPGGGFPLATAGRLQRNRGSVGRARIAAAIGGASVNRFLPFLLLTACAAQRLTHSRDNFRSCWAADPNLIACGGKRVATVECFAPGEEACGALAVHYADGERVFLSRPAGFEPGNEASLTPGAVLRPELSSD